MVNRTGHPAAMPDPAVPAVRPPNRRELKVWHTNTAGDVDFSFDFATLRMAHPFQILFANFFEEKTAPLGSWASPVTARSHIYAVRRFARFCNESERHVQSIEALTPGVLNDLQLSWKAKSIFDQMARMLRDQPGLPEKSREILYRRSKKTVARHGSYDPSEIAYVRSKIESMLAEVEDRVVPAAARLRSAVVSSPELAHIVSEVTNDPWLPPMALNRTLNDYRESIITLNGVDETFQSLIPSLFVTKKEVTVMVLAMILEYGWNLSSVVELAAPKPFADPDEASTGQYQLTLEKRRRGGRLQFETRTVPYRNRLRGQDLITRILAITATTRRAAAMFGEAPNRLFVFRAGNAAAGESAFRNLRHFSVQDLERSMPELRGLLSPLRIRKTVNVMEQKLPNQNSDAVHLTRYVLPDKNARRAAAPAIVSGLQNALKTATAGYEGKFAAYGSANPTSETAVASCRDLKHSPIQPDNGPCTSPVLLCLSCPNAVLNPEHLPRVTLLHAALSEVRSAEDPETWNHTWKPTFERLEDIRLNYPTQGEWTKASGHVTTLDREMLPLILGGEFDVR